VNGGSGTKCAGVPTHCTTLIVDDDPDMRFLVSTTIEVANDGLEVAAEVGTASAAVGAWREHRPDVVLLDHRMPGRTGLDIATEILAEDPNQHVLLFSAYFDDEIVAEAARIGVRECVSKDYVKALPAILRKYCSN
jgi:DNA-binding NarL/FixJ family response regulator